MFTVPRGNLSVTFVLMHLVLKFPLSLLLPAPELTLSACVKLPFLSSDSIPPGSVKCPSSHGSLRNGSSPEGPVPTSH